MRICVQPPQKAPEISTSDSNSFSFWTTVTYSLWMLLLVLYSNKFPTAVSNFIKTEKKSKSPCK